MVLPLTGSDLISLAVASESLFGELFLITLTYGIIAPWLVSWPFSLTAYVSALFDDV